MPVLTDTRLSEARWNVRQYINAKPTVLVLLPTRGSKVDKPGGGHDFAEPVPRTPQTFRIDETSGNAALSYSPNDEGEVRKYAYALLGAYDAVLEIGDSWDEGDRHYHVDTLEPYNGYEVRATVTAFAAEPEHG